MRSSGIAPSHQGRGAAPGAGVLGVGGLAEHERYGDDSTTGTGHGSEGIGGALGSGARGYGPADWEHEHQRHGHRYEGDPCAHGDVEPVGPRLTSGPHATDTANRLDPHVAGNTGPLETTAGEALGHQHGHHGVSATGTGVPLAGTETGIGGSSTEYDNQNQNLHLGREAALTGGVGTGLSGTTAGTTGRDYDSTRGSFLPGTDNQTGTGHHYGRDAGVAGAGAGAVGGVEYSKHEAGKHRNEGDSHERKKQGGILGFLHHDKDSTSDRSSSQSGHSHDSHQGAKTTAGVGAAGAGTAAYEYEEHGHERNRLHKDPPEGYASQVTGGTGTTALAEGGSVQRGSHISGVGNKLDPR